MDTSARPRKKPHRAWLMLICMMLLQTGGLGIICNCFGTFIQPVCSDTGISYSDLSLYYSWECVAMLLFIPFANKILMKYKNVRLILFIAMTQSCISTGVMGLFDHAYLWWIAGISDGLAQSFITFLIIPYIINNWFHKYNGAIIGVCCAFACIGGAIFAPVCGSFIANYGWRISYPIAAALAWIICVPIPCIFLRDTPEQCGLKPYGAAETQGSEAPEAVSAAASEVDRSNFGVEYKTATRSACYVLLMVFGFCIACMCCFSTHLTSYAYTLGFPVESGSFATSLCMTGSVVGSFFIGRMSDRIGAPKAIAVGMAFGIAGILVDMLFTSYSPYFVFLGSFMFGVCYVCYTITPPLLSRYCWGEKEQQKIYGVSMWPVSLASIIAVWFYGFVRDTFGNYDLALVVVLSSIVITMLSAFMAARIADKRWPDRLGPNGPAMKLRTGNTPEHISEGTAL